MGSYSVLGWAFSDRSFIVQNYVNCPTFAKAHAHGMELLIDVYGQVLAQNGSSRNAFNPNMSFVVMSREFNCTLKLSDVYEAEEGLPEIVQKFLIVDSDFLQVIEVTINPSQEG